MILCGISAQALAELASTSPFLPPAGQAVAAPSTPSALELRGVSTIGNATMFSIFDPAKKSGTWVKLNEPGYDFAVKKYDAENDTVTVEYQGRTLNLVMRTPKIASSGSAVAPPPGAVPSPIVNVAPNPAARPAVPNPTPPNEAARMAEWSAEIQRRRDMRNQAAATQNTGPQPLPMPQPTQMTPQAQPQPNNPGNFPRQRANPRR